LKKEDVYAYTVFMIVLVFILTQFSGGRFTVGVFITSFTAGIMVFALIVALLQLLLFDYDFFKIKNKLKEKMPSSVFSFIISMVLGFIILIFSYGPSYLLGRINDVYIDLTEPFGRTRWALTVAEAHQPYFVDWIGQTNWKYVLSALIGSIWLFYDMIVKFLSTKKERIIATGLYTLLMVGWLLNRYSQSSRFNGNSGISKFL